MPQDYNERTVDDLHDLASQRGVPGHSKMNKAELVAALEGTGDPDEMMVATESGSCDIGGQMYTFNRGVTRVARNHPLVSYHPDWFEPAGYSMGVEDATAAPGEKRGGKKS